MNILQLRTKLSTINIRWTNLPYLSNFNQYQYVTDIDIDIDDYRIIGYIELNNNIYHHNNHKAIYLISDLQSTIYVSLGFSNPTLWYPITLDENNNLTSIHMELLSDIIEIYDIPDDIDYDVTKYILIGDMYQINQNIKSIQNHFLKSNIIEVLMWGSKHESYPYNRLDIMYSNNKDKINYITKAMEQNDNQFSVSCRTLWSKSSIKIVQKLNYITLEIKYNTIKNNTTVDLINQYYSNDLPLNIPTDLAIALINLPYNDVKQLINDNDNIPELVTLLKVLIPKSEIHQLMFDLDNYCDNEEKVKSLRNELG